ncbi:MAG: hypothetical protein AB1749_12565 [Pseudomonadota bacterium]
MTTVRSCRDTLASGRLVARAAGGGPTSASAAARHDGIAAVDEEGQLLVPPGRGQLSMSRHSGVLRFLSRGHIGKKYARIISLLARLTAQRDPSRMSTNSWH